MDEPSPLTYRPPIANDRPLFRPLPLIAREEPRANRLIAGGLACLFAVAYFWFILQYWAPAHPGTDQNGYLVGGKMLAQTGTTGFKPEPLGFVGNMWVLADKAKPTEKEFIAAIAAGKPIETWTPDVWVYPKYPVGLPLLYAVVLWTCGSVATKAAFLVSPIGAAAAVLGMYFLTRRFAGTFASLMAMLVLAFGQVMLVLADNPNSHASCLAFGVWGMCLLVGFWQTGSVWRGLLGGFLLGYAVTIRYTEGLMGLMIGVLILSVTWQINRRVFVATCATIGVIAIWILSKTPGNTWLGIISDFLELSDSTVKVGLYILGSAILLVSLALSFKPFRDDPKLWGRLYTPAFGWLIPVAYLVGFNLVAMHTPTGYDSTNESVPGAAFTLDHIAQNWDKTVRQLHDIGLFFVLPLGLLGMGLAIRDSGRRGSLLWLWFVPGTLLYTAYYWAPERGVSYLRFFLTVLPPVVVGVGVLIDHLIAGSVTRWQRAVTPIACGIVVAISCGNSLYRGLLGIEEGQEAGQGMESLFRQQVNLAALGDVVTQAVPKGSLVIAPPAQLNYLQFAGDYQCYSTEAFTTAFYTRVSRKAEASEDPDPIQPALSAWYAKQLEGKNDAQLAAMQMDLIRKQLDDGRRAFIVCRRDQTAAFTARYKRGTGLTWKPVAFYHDLPRLRAPDEPGVNSTDPGQRMIAQAGRRGPGAGRGPGGGGGRGRLANAFRGEVPTQQWQVIEIKRAQA